MRSHYLIIGLLVGIVFFSACELSTNFSVGDSVRIHKDGLTTITVAIDSSAWNDLQNIWQASDEVGYNQLLRSGRIFTISNGTRALVLDKGFTKVKVRITSGQHTGRVGYVPRDWVEKR